MWKSDPKEPAIALESIFPLFKLSTSDCEPLRRTGIAFPITVLLSSYFTEPPQRL